MIFGIGRRFLNGRSICVKFVVRIARIRSIVSVAFPPLLDEIVTLMLNQLVGNVFCSWVN